MPWGWTRRQALAGIALGLGALVRPGRHPASARADKAPPVAPPRYWIHAVVCGGLDAVWTTDPKLARDVAPGVDVPYRADDIVTAGSLRLGPHYAALAPHAGRVSIVNAVLVNTANHYTGIEQSARLRTRTTMRTPAVFDIVGAHRDSQAVGNVSLTATMRQAQTAGFFGTSTPGDFGGGASVLDEVAALAPDDRRALAALLDRRARSLTRAGASPAQMLAIDNMRQVSQLLARTADVPAFAPSTWLGERDSEMETLLVELQRALWLIENDLAAAVTVFLSNVAWDTHGRNTSGQSRLTPPFARGLARLFTELASRSNRHGRLADTTSVIVTSEIGRFPYLNPQLGKDHFPQTAVVVSGPGFAAGRQFGVTGKEMEAVAISPETGRPAPGGERLILDDVGHTVLELAGIRAEAYAVAGRTLRFVTRAG